jgi:hypothetical protein
MCFAGAVIGGFSGGFFTFLYVGQTGIGDYASDAIVFVVGLLLALCGAYIGILITKAIHGDPRIQLKDTVVVVILGVLGGIAGYFWLYWVLSYADF